MDSRSRTLLVLSRSVLGTFDALNTETLKNIELNIKNRNTGFCVDI